MVEKMNGFDIYIYAFYCFKSDLLTNTLTPKIQSEFHKRNQNGKRLKELSVWQQEFLNKKRSDIPTEINIMMKELRLL